MKIQENLSNKNKAKTIILLLFVIIILALGGYFLMKKMSIKPAPINKETPQIKNDFKYYKIVNNIAYYKDKEIQGADILTFQELEDEWAKDKNSVYLEGQKQSYLDPETIKIFPTVYVADKTNVWVYGTRYHMKVIKTDADPATFSTIGRGYGKDKNNIYYFEQKIINADTQSFSLLFKTKYLSSGEFVSNWYAKDKNNAYYRSSLIPGADVKSFVSLGNSYAKDNYRVYYGETILENADTNTFILAEEYAKDKNHVFYGGEELKIEINPDSFTVLREGVIKDNKRVYFFDKFNDKYVLISNVDAPTFQYIGTCRSVERSSGFYFKDKNYVFIGDEPAYNIDVSTFEYFGDYLVVEGMPFSVSYARDKNSIYHSCGEILENADKATFVNLGDGYAKDKNNVWYLAGIIEEADAKTFKSLEGNYAKDKNHAYFDGSIIENADAASFTVVKEKVPEEDKGNEIFYAKDKNNIYSGNEIIKGVNPEKCVPESIKECEPNSDF